MDEADLPRQERRRLRRRREVLDVAMRLFSEKGYHNVLMEEIARKAEFSVGTLYTIFPNKDELYKTVATEKAREFHGLLSGALQIKGSAKDKICNYVRVIIDLFNANITFFSIYMLEIRGIPHRIKSGVNEEIKEMYDDVMDRMADVFAKGMKKNQFRKTDPFLLAVGLDGLISAFFSQHIERSAEHSFDADTILEIFFSGVLNND